MNNDWPGVRGPTRIPAILRYNESYENVISWGAKALAGEPSRRNVSIQPGKPKPVELFKRYLGETPDDKEPKLPTGVTPITDYLREMGNQSTFFLFIMMFTIPFSLNL